MFSFNAGCFNDIWINNCVAVGLSGGFIEPLEATSIWVATQTLKTLKIKEAGIFQRDQQAISQFNSIIRNMNVEIVSFIHFHYLSKRNDTEFWRNFKKNNSSPAIMQAFQDISNRTLPSQRDIDYINTVFGFTDDPNYIRTFEIANWHTVGAGLKFFKSNFDITSINKSDYIASLLSKSQELIDHMEYLEILRNAS
jgi:tryptophan halogenase